ncbi:hypothetical protein WDR79_004712 [Citrobacter freundii]|nr:hypothetical protein [Citrobacter freundii]
MSVVSENRTPHFLSPVAETLLMLLVLAFIWMMRALKRRALFVVVSPELLIWNLGTASAWNKYLRSL